MASSIIGNTMLRCMELGQMLKMEITDPECNSSDITDGSLDPGGKEVLG